MYHQWFNSAEYGKKETELINAIKALGSKPIKYGEQPAYEEKMKALVSKFKDYVEYCETGHKKEIEKQNNNLTK